jgi:hypothetical protein
MTIAVTMVVAALTLEHNVEVHNRLGEGTGIIGASSVGDRVTHLVFLLSGILIVLAGINAIFTTWATVIDAQRPTALARALGATPARSPPV